MSKLIPEQLHPNTLLADIRMLIAAARSQAAVAVNVGLTSLYWRIGRRIHTEVLGSEPATYGEQIVATLSRELVAEFGRGYTETNLRRMIQFADAFPDEEIVATVWRHLSWSHFRELLPLSDGRIPAKHCSVFLFQHVRIREPKRSHTGTFLAAKPKTPSFSMVTV